MGTSDPLTTRSSTRRAGRGAIAVVALGLTIITGAQASATAAQEEPAGGIGLRLLEAPVATSDDPRARIYIVDHLPPGTVIERRVEVANTTDKAQAVVLYSAAATIDDGTFVGSPGRALNDLASWTSVSPGTTTVPAGGTTTTLVTIAVPGDAAPGEQYAVVWAEARSAPADAGGVVQVSRVGIRLYVSIGAGGPPAADFEIEALTAERSADGTPVVSATVRNTGGRALDMKGTLELTNGPAGLAAGPFPAEVGSTLAIGETESVRITLDERLPDGPWDAVVHLESGLTERSASARITFPATGAAAPVTVTKSSAGRPWALILGAVGVLALLAGAAGRWFLLRTRARRCRPSLAAPAHAKAHAASPSVPAR